MQKITGRTTSFLQSFYRMTNWRSLLLIDSHQAELTAPTETAADIRANFSSTFLIGISSEMQLKLCVTDAFVTAMHGQVS